MKTREHANETTPQQPTLGGMEGGNDLEAIRRSAEAMLAAGDAAIKKVLSGDSAQFIQQARQQGGE